MAAASDSMKTWRERLADYEALGDYTQEDADALGRIYPNQHSTAVTLCAIGEQMRAYGFGSDELLCDLGTRFMNAWFHARCKKELFAELHRLLDAIEDRALELKRAGGSHA